MKALGAALAALLACGCGWDEQGNAPSPSARRPGAIAQVETAPQPPPSAPAPLQQPGSEAARPSMFKQEAKAAEEKPKEPERDYPAELLYAIGTPADCLKPRSGPDAPPSIRVAIEVYAIETGLVTRAYARSAQLDDGELECIRKRLGALRLRAPIDAAPRNVSATLEFTLKPKTSEKSGP